MPLRSVEAASRDDAIAAAREQFGPQARVVGVRRVRSGGVLGFFATERYVAEVAEMGPDTAGRPAVNARSGADDVPPADFSSPLASAAPARARATAPARNGAAAWAAEAAARSADDGIPPEVRAAAAAARAARSTSAARPAVPTTGPAHTPAPARKAPEPAAPRPDDERVSELAGLLAAHQSEPATPTYSRATFPRASFPRTGTVSRPGDSLLDDDAETRAAVRGSDPGAAPAPASPSPFTAALARMVAGDRDVQQAVKEALAPPVETRPRDDAEPWPVRSEPVRTADSSVSPSTAGQEEETVGDQVIAPPSTTDRPVEVPPWATEPEAPAASVSAREEAIADLLRGALAQGHSDEALAGILRKVLAGASPQTALTEPEPAFAVPAEPTTPVPAEPVFAVSDEPVFAVPTEPVFALPTEPVSMVAAEPVFAVPAEPLFAAPCVDVAELDQPVPAAPAVPVVETPVVEAPVAEPISPVAETAPVTLSTPAEMWGTPSLSATLWGEAVPAPRGRGTTTHSPIWAEDVPAQPAPALFSAPTTADAVTAPAVEPPMAEIPAVEIPTVETPAVETPAEAPSVGTAVAEQTVLEAPVAEEPVVEDVVAEQVEDQAVEEVLDETEEEAGIAELAPVLARTASDPAPMMSLDATTVMPPLSLLPPLPSSRGRGRPPVPPAAPRPSASSRSSAAVPTAPASAAAEQTPDRAGSALTGAPKAGAPTPAVEAPEPIAQATLATVTRLPVAPLTADPEIAELTEDSDELGTEELTAGTTTPDVAEAPESSVAPAAPAEDATDDVAARLRLLGVPGELLGSTFAEDVAARGIYAALTRSLALQLPKAPELPRGAGEALFVVGPGADALRAARSLAASLHLDPDCVQWATRGDLAGLAPRSSRVTSVDAAIDRRQESAAAGTVTIVAVDAPLRTDSYWMAQMMSVWTPAAVWAVVEATRKPEDLEPWLDGLPRVDALIVQDTDLSADPAAVLRRVNAPVALLDGARATPHRWASLLCERLESTTT